eukprot:TRINITY_DN1451_c0_g1_i3.p1 TRINITY_DN1451_c0_g1~~TRINITY_DN1451_c0_g1_i3.p1  ORF type:complete len:209 (+),score=31.97 TRINITY_DN1451_c0_g1_i3:204-830(+)
MCIRDRFYSLFLEKDPMSNSCEYQQFFKTHEQAKTLQKYARLRNQQTIEQQQQNIIYQILETLSECPEEPQNQELINQTKNNIFYTQRPPKYTLKEFFERFNKYIKCSFSQYVIALIYMGLYSKKARILIDSHNIHQLFLVAVLIAEKTNNDYIISKSMSVFSTLGGIDLKLLNQLEQDFLIAVEYRLFITEEEYNKNLKLISKFLDN